MRAIQLDRVLRVLIGLARPASTLALVGMLAVLLTRLHDARLALDYVRAFLWPLVAICAIWWLRAPLREKVRDLLKVGGPLSLEFARHETEQLGETVQEVSEELREAAAEEDQARKSGKSGSTPDTVPSGVASDATPVSPIGMNGDQERATAEERASNARAVLHESNARVAELRRRRAIERVMEQAAHWGFSMAKAGLTSSPSPVIRWDDGQPRIEYGAGSQPATHHAAKSGWDEYVRNLEAEVRRLEREYYTSRYGPFSGIVDRLSAAFPLEQQLKDAKKRLQAAYPASGLLP